MVQNITFGHTCRLAGHEQATLLVCFFGHTCSSKWSHDQNHGIRILEYPDTRKPGRIQLQLMKQPYAFP